MTELNLLDWALEYYFPDWEIERAKKVLDEKGMDAAVEYLRKRAMESCRGQCGPDSPSLDTRASSISLRLPTTSIMASSDLVYDIAWFCRRKLDSLFQLKLL